MTSVVAEWVRQRVAGSEGDWNRWHVDPSFRDVGALSDAKKVQEEGVQEE